MSFDFSLAPPDERVLAAVSGGADSMALLWMLQNAGRDFVVGHVNHGLKELRGDEGDCDEEFVVSHCQKIGAPVDARRVGVPRINGHASEEAARTARYEALMQMAREHGCARIATAHTASDVLETVLLHWLRGATISGFAGIPPQRELEAGVLLVRPMLGLTRQDSETICREAGWDWREDNSNANRDFARNRVRHDLILQLAGVGRISAQQLARQTARSAALWRDDLDYLDAAARVELEKLVRPTRECEDRTTLALDGVGFCELPAALQRRLIRAALEKLEGQKRDLSARQIEEVREHILAGGRRRVWSWRRGVFVEWTGAMAGNRLRLWRVL